MAYPHYPKFPESNLLSHSLSPFNLSNLPSLLFIIVRLLFLYYASRFCSLATDILPYFIPIHYSFIFYLILVYICVNFLPWFELEHFEDAVFVLWLTYKLQSLPTTHDRTLIYPGKSSFCAKIAVSSHVTRCENELTVTIHSPFTTQQALFHNLRTTLVTDD